MIRCHNLSYRIGDKLLLDSIDLELEAGKLNLIIGANGAGKSTLIKCLSRQLKSAENAIWLADQKLESYTHNELARIRAVLSQNTELAFPLRVAEVVMMGRYPHFTGKPQKIDEEACREAMELFDISAFAERNYLSLSGGEKQRVQFARVLTQIWFPVENADRYLFLDEPLTFLDIQYQYKFMRQLKELVSEQKLVVVGVVHDLNLAAQFADKLCLIHEGKMLIQGKPEEVLTVANIEKAFQLKPEILTLENGIFIRFS